MINFLVSGTFRDVVDIEFHTKGKKLGLSCPVPEVINLFSCSAQVSMIFFLLINVKMPTIVGILRFMSRKNSILSLSEPEKC